MADLVSRLLSFKNRWTIPLPGAGLRSRGLPNLEAPRDGGGGSSEQTVPRIGWAPAGGPHESMRLIACKCKLFIEL